MRTLFLLRHAKSSWADPTLADHDRPLAPRGRRAAKRIARYVASDGAIRPGLVLCSTATRARDTLDALQPSLDDACDVQVVDEVYGADVHQLIDRLRAIEGDVASVMIIGHNPALHALALELTGDGAAAALAQLRAKFPTGALATLELAGSTWKGLAAGQAYLARLVLPRQLS